MPEGIQSQRVRVGDGNKIRSPPLGGGGGG